jgi:hypothetical protein
MVPCQAGSTARCERKHSRYARRQTNFSWGERLAALSHVFGGGVISFSR